MPHLILEYSSNLKTKPSKELLSRLHESLPALGPFELHSIKSRILEHQVYCVADGDPDAGFVHLELRILSGRAPEIKQRVSKGLAEILKDFFAADLSARRMSVTVEIRDLDAECYSKVSTIER